MLLRLTSVTVLAVLSLSPPPSQGDEIAALRRDVQALKAQQQAMEQDLQTIKSLLQGLSQQRGREADPFINKTLSLDKEPTKGDASARVTLVEVSDFHCPFCRRQTLQTMPKVMADAMER